MRTVAAAAGQVGRDAAYIVMSSAAEPSLPSSAVRNRGTMNGLSGGDSCLTTSMTDKGVTSTRKGTPLTPYFKYGSKPSQT